MIIGNLWSGIGYTRKQCGFTDIRETNQTYIGNMHPDELGQHPQPWVDTTVDGLNERVGKYGEIMPEDEFYMLMQCVDVFELVMLDKENQVLRKSIIWCDQRTAAEVEEMNRVVGREKLMEITANPALTGWTAAKILWVRNNEPDVYEKCRHILLPKDYLRLILTGEYATEVSDASGMQLLDIANRCWSDELLHLLQIDKDLLGKVHESCEVTGTLTHEMADTLGLCEGTAVQAITLPLR